MAKYSSLFAEDEAGASPAAATTGSEPATTSDEPVSNTSDDMATTGFGLKKKLVTRKDLE